MSGSQNEFATSSTSGLCRKGSSAVLILLYHRVAELPTDPQLLCVSPRHFAEHLRIVSERYIPISLAECVRLLRVNDLPDKAVVVTFDDGYADNLHAAAPLLSEYGIPATVFVSPDEDVERCEFWWDELDRLLLQPGTLPAELQIDIDETTHEWRFGNDADYDPDSLERYRCWSVLDAAVPTMRHHAYLALCELLRPLHAKRRGIILDQLRTLCNAPVAARPTHRALSGTELTRLAEMPSLEVGAHSMTHPVLSSMPAAIQKSEIRRCKSHLERVIGKSVTSFSYPYGTRHDYSDETVSIVRQAGFSCACANQAGRVTAQSDPFRLPRLLVRDCEADTFAGRLEEMTCRV